MLKPLPLILILCVVVFLSHEVLPATAEPEKPKPITTSGGLFSTAGNSLKLALVGPKLLELHRPWVRIGNNVLVELSAEEFAKIAAAYVVENKDGKNAIVIYGPPPAPASTP